MPRGSGCRNAFVYDAASIRAKRMKAAILRADKVFYVNDE